MKFIIIYSSLFQDPQTPEDDLDLSSEDEAVASDLDMHSLILGSLNQDTEPLKTADEVIREIDDMMQDDSSIDGSPECNEVMEKAKEVLSSPLYEDSKYHLVLVYSTHNFNSSSALSFFIMILVHQTTKTTTVV